ncbi:DUF4267 domain-containing protein [Lentzea sp. NPDC004789]
MRLSTIMGWLVVLAGFWFGLGYLLDGSGAAAGFGVVDPSGYYVVKGVRDIAYALTALTLLLMKQYRALGWVVLADAIIPIGDFFAVITSGGSLVTAITVHGTAAVLVLLTAGLLLKRTAPARPQPVPSR